MSGSASRSPFAPRFTTIRDPFLSRWQSIVESIALRELPPERRTRAAAIAHPAVQGVLHHVRAVLAGLEVEAPRDGAKDRVRQALAYLSSLYFGMALAKAQQRPEDVRKTELEIRKFATDDYSVVFKTGWMTAKTEFERWYGSGDVVDYDAKGIPHPTGARADYAPYVKPPNNRYGVLDYRLKKNAKVAILGDWGTGMPDAKALLERVFAELEPDAIVHLGDIYYSGTPEECRRNFTDVIKACRRAHAPGKKIPVFTIPGNHEYYSGGKGFFEMLGEINEGIPGATQEASYFCLRTEDQRYQLLGMDTGRLDFDPHRVLHEMRLFDWYYGTKVGAPPLLSEEAAWHVDKLEHFGGLTILFSHHQLYSANARLNGEDTHLPAWLNTGLFETFSPYFDKIAGWFWGHEHNMAFYHNDFLGLSRGRLLGASAYEETEGEDPYARNFDQVPYLPDMPRLELSPYYYEDYVYTGEPPPDDKQIVTGPKYYNHSCALIDFGRPAPAVTYYQYPSWGNRNEIEAPPALDPIAWPSGGGDFLAVPERTLERDWKVDISSCLGDEDDRCSDTSGRNDVDVAVGADYLFAGSHGLVHQLDRKSGEWRDSTFVRHTGYPVHLLSDDPWMVLAASAGYVDFIDPETLRPAKIGSRQLDPVDMNARATKTDEHRNNVTRLLRCQAGLFAACNGIVCQIDRDTGRRVRRVDLEGLREGKNQKIKPAEVRLAYHAGENRLYCGTYGYLVGLDAGNIEDATKRTVRSLPDTGTGKISVRVVAGRVFAAGSGRLFRLEPWSYTLLGDKEHEVNFAPALDQLIVGVAGTVGRYDPSNLTTMWPGQDGNMDHAGHSVVHLQPEAGYVLAGARGYLYEFDLKTGERRDALPGDRPGDQPGSYQRLYGESDDFGHNAIGFALSADRLYAAGNGWIQAFRYWPDG